MLIFCLPYLTVLHLELLVTVPHELLLLALTHTCAVPRPVEGAVMLTVLEDVVREVVRTPLILHPEGTVKV